MKKQGYHILILISWLTILLVWNSWDKRSLDPWIWQEFRLPRIMSALGAGIGLSLSGLMMQTLFRNPLAGPFLIGVTPGATLGMAVYVFTGTVFGLELSQWGSHSSSLIGALAALFIQLSFNRGFNHPIRLLLIGMVLGFIFSAGVQLLVQFGSAADIQRYTFWGMGSFDQVNAANWVYLWLPSILLTILLWWYRTALDAYLLGDEYAFSSGTPLTKIRVILILGGALTAGWITSFVGPIGFVGLVAPHIAKRILQTESHSSIIIPTLLWGAALCLSADTISHHLLSSTVLPVNPIMALIGAPILIFSLYREKFFSH